MNIQRKVQYKWRKKSHEPNFEKSALTNNMQKAHNISKNTTKTDFKEISTNNESNNNDTNIKLDKLGMENSFMLEDAKAQEWIDKDNKLESVLGMTSTASLATSI